MKPSPFLSVLFGLVILWSARESVSQNIVTFQPGPGSGIDATLFSINPDQNRSSEQSLLACAWTFGGDQGVERGLLKFDLASIPSSVTVVDARLSLFYFQGGATGHSGSNTGYLQKVVENWNQYTVTWNTQPLTTEIGEVTLPESYSQNQDYPDIDLKQFVSGWVADPQYNFGMLFRLRDEILYASMLFASSDNITASLRPKLTVTYKYCTGPVAGFSYAVAGGDVKFHDVSSHAQTWYWDFGDGYFSNLQNPVHTYLQPGKYVTCLSVFDECSTDQFCDTVLFCKPPEPRFSYVTSGHLISFADSSYLPQTWYWSFGDNFYSDLQNPIHYFKDPGTYYVCLTSANTCSRQTYCDSIEFKTTGVKEITRQDFRIFPVPAFDHLYLIWSAPLQGRGEIEVTDARGNLVVKKMIRLSPNVMFEKLDLSGYPPGVFFLRLFSGSLIYCNKFIVI